MIELDEFEFKAKDYFWMTFWSHLAKKFLVLVEIWFSGLSRRVLRRGNFKSVDQVQEKITEYITFYNKTARPMKWNYDGKKKTKIMKNI